MWRISRFLRSVARWRSDECRTLARRRGKSHAAAFANANFGSATSRIVLPASASARGSEDALRLADFSTRGRKFRSVEVDEVGGCCVFRAGDARDREASVALELRAKIFCQFSGCAIHVTSFDFCSRGIALAPIVSLRFEKLKRIDRRFSGRASLPALVNPEPLVGMLAT